MLERETLCNGGLLTASHISAANSLLQKKFKLQNGLHDSHYLAVKQEWNSGPQDFVQIIYVKPGHWACLSNKFCVENTVELFDSMHTEPIEEGTILKQACCILKSQNASASNITINVISVTPQEGGTDCGLFAICMAYDLCIGIDPSTQRVLQAKMREHLLYCFENEEISAFPRVKQGFTRKRVLLSLSFSIYCICRGPDIKPMASCDVCMEWFHPSCVSIPDEVFQYEETSWICPKCKSYASFEPTIKTRFT